MIEAASTSEMSVTVFETTRRNNPEDGLLHACRRENLKSRFEDDVPRHQLGE
jgi:hypothetical protein